MRRAFAYGTLVPLAPPKGPPRPSDHLAWPLVGALVGVAWVLVGRGMTVLLGPAVAAGAVVLVDAWLTRALHLDGLAGVVDGVAAGEDPAGVVEVVREAGLRAAGFAAVLGVSLVRFGVLIQVVFPPGDLVLGLVPAATLALIAAPAAGRLAMVACWWRGALRDDEPDGLAFARPTAAVLAGAATLALVLSAAAGLTAVVTVAVGLAAGAGLASWWRRRYGPLTAEVPAAACLVGETLALLVVARAIVS